MYSHGLVRNQGSAIINSKYLVHKKCFCVLLKKIVYALTSVCVLILIVPISRTRAEEDFNRGEDHPANLMYRSV